MYPLSETLDWFADHLWGQYGLSILVVTIIIRFIILPLTLKQYRSSKRMQDLQPEMKKLKEKYKDDAKKQQEETMKLFQTNGVNPLAGCFPILVQMPILIALYQAIMRNQDIHTHTFLWLNLGSPDKYYILPLIAALTTFIQQKFMATQMNPQMQSLMFIFPVLIFVMSMNFAAALPLYWVYSNIFTIVQSYFIYGGFQQNKAKGGLSK
ncbi:Membrane protein insertase MisCA precursor [compost metagenome]